MVNEAWLFTFCHWTHGCDVSVVKNYLKVITCGLLSVWETVNCSYELSLWEKPLTPECVELFVCCRWLVLISIIRNNLFSFSSNRYRNNHIWVSHISLLAIIAKYGLPIRICWNRWIQWQKMPHFRKIIQTCHLLCKVPKKLPRCQQDPGSREDLQTEPNLCFNDLSDSLNSLKFWFSENSIDTIQPRRIFQITKLSISRTSSP